MYRDFKVRVKDIAPHNMLALLRGETEGVLDLELSFDEEVVMSYLESQKFIPKFERFGLLSRDAQGRVQPFDQSFLINEVRSGKTYADVESIKTFETNLRELLLSSCRNETDAR